MRPSEIYATIEQALSNNPKLTTIPKVQNTYQEKLVDSVASKHLADCGIVICYYFLRVMEPVRTRDNLVQGDALFTLAVVENVAQHDKWRAANAGGIDADDTFKTKSALEIAEEVMVTMVTDLKLRPCGFPDLKFAKPPLERVQSEGGLAQFDVNVLAASQVRSG